MVAVVFVSSSCSSSTNCRTCVVVVLPIVPVVAVALGVVSVKAVANEDTMLRTYCCGHKCFPVCPCAQHLLRTQNLCPRHKNVSDFFQKHFVPATNVSRFTQYRNNHEQQCVPSIVSSFATTLIPEVVVVLVVPVALAVPVVPVEAVELVVPVVPIVLIVLVSPVVLLVPVVLVRSAFSTCGTCT